MLWLFGQIWLWLLVSFLLGAAAAGLLMRAARPKPAEEPRYLPAAESPAEEPPANPYQDYDEPYRHYEDEPERGYEPERVYNDYPDVDPDEPYDAHYPAAGAHARHEPEADPHPRLSGELNWPAGDQPGPHWPHEDDPAPRRPGRSG